MLGRNYIQPEPSNEILAARIAQRDVAALEMIYDRFASRMFSLATMLSDCAEAERIVLQVFSRLWMEANQFNLHGGSFQDWLLDLTRNHILVSLKTQEGQTSPVMVEAINRWLSETASQMARGREELHKPGSGNPGWQALQDLPSEQRCVIVLARYGGFKQKEIAQILGCSLSTVQQNAMLGLQQLRDALKSGLVLEGG